MDNITLEPTKIGINAGMLWFDNSDLPLEDKIIGAAIYYLDKYHMEPKTAYLPENQQITLDWIKVENRHWIMSNHIWLG